MYDADVIVLDLALEATEGLDTLEAMRHLAPTTPIIVVTGRDDLGLQSRMLGAVGYIHKDKITDHDLATAVLVARSARVRRLGDPADRVDTNEQ